MGLFDGVFKRNLEIRDMLDLDLYEDSASRSYLKRIALDTCINFIARTISQTEFWIKDGDKSIKNTLYYKLNVRPNTDSSASDFWQKVIYKLIYDNEVLIIKTDTDDLVVADDFERVELALYDDTFRNVIVKDYKFQRSFKMNEVIYLNYNNEKLQKYIEGLFGDYGELFGRMMQQELKNNQIRGILKVSQGGGKLDDKNMSRLQKYADKIYQSFTKSSVAIIPGIPGFEYEEITKGQSSSNSNAENISKVKKAFIDDVAKIIGIPPSLLHGEMADLENAMDAYLDFCIKPLVKKMENELNSKFFTQDEFLKGKRIKLVGLNRLDPVKNATSIDKLISSNFATINEVRDLFGFEQLDGLDIFLRTKNYEPDNEASKGGDNE
ncbi:phage portal protein [Macrococcus armenti]|uniref:phage portal protein n=1 Tax=Macrococcus armenti TaxID=2875764 RepID=UPI001CC9AAEA|nr:phage portal protein [Macrococcus armenti]UBH14858.1 phage portal protein [Macrococcus armenti]UBH17218.1 phage portal protein [Macrococcus armenti]UBH19483.1 phage portal protein [Macrococcus armenti]